MSKNIDLNTIAAYYDKNQILYNLLWSRKASHYGFWDSGQVKHSCALENTNAFAAQCLSVERADVILDAGCGAGGIAVWMTEKFGANIIGITLSDVQLRQAQKLASRSASGRLTRFLKMDYHKTSFEDRSFSKIYAIESSCQSTNKRGFLREMYRVLKPGGKITVFDFFITKVKTDKEHKILEDFLYGWAIPYLSSRESFKKGMLEAGFKNITSVDKSDAIKRSVRIAYNWGLWLYPLSWLGNKLHLTPRNMHPHCIACINQESLFNNRIMNYIVFTAEK